MSTGHENGGWMNDDQRGGHDEIGALLGVLRSFIEKSGDHPEAERTGYLYWLDKTRAEVELLRERHLKAIDNLLTSREQRAREAEIRGASHGANQMNRGVCDYLRSVGQHAWAMAVQERCHWPAQDAGSLTTQEG